MAIDMIFTGGTIGSRVNQEGYLATEEDMPYCLLKQFRDTYQISEYFRTHEPYRILSENLSVREMNLLMEAVRSLQCQEDTEGIIITHGTDSLTYTAALLSYAFCDTKVPIILVSSNYMLEDPRANGLINLKGAYEFIRQIGVPGVYVSYTNPGDCTRIHCGTRINKSLSYTDAIYSILDQWYARWDGTGMQVNPALDQGAVRQDRDPETKTGDEAGLSDAACCLFGAQPEQSVNSKVEASYMKECGEQILVIYPGPFVKFPELESSVKVVLFDSYHSGTIAFHASLQEFCNKVKRRGIPMYLVGLNPYETAYETVQVYETLGIKPLGAVAMTAQYMKCAFALSVGLDLEPYMSTPVSCDHVKLSDNYK